MNIAHGLDVLLKWTVWCTYLNAMRCGSNDLTIETRLLQYYAERLKPVSLWTISLTV